MSIIAQDELSGLHARAILDGKKIAFCSGSFDLTHVGHALFFEDCKKHADILVVGVGADALIRTNKGGNRPFLNEHIRAKMVDSMKPVDYVFIHRVSSPGNNLIVGLSPVFDTLKPDIYVINDDAYDIKTRESLVKKYAISLIILKRTCPPEFENISTTKIVEKIKRETC